MWRGSQARSRRHWFLLGLSFGCRFRTTDRGAYRRGRLDLPLRFADLAHHDVTRHAIAIRCETKFVIEVSVSVGARTAGVEGFSATSLRTSQFSSFASLATTSPGVECPAQLGGHDHIAEPILPSGLADVACTLTTFSK